MSVSPVNNTTISEAASAHTLQAFIELIYVKTANDVLVQHMASLEQQLAVTQNTMDILTRIQNLHNLVTVKSKGSFGGPSIYNNPNLSIEDYRNRASAFFGTPVGVSVSFTTLSGGVNGFLSQMQAIRTQLVSQISALVDSTPTLSNGQEDSNSLLAKLRLVLKDIDDTHAASTAAGAQAWVIDNYNSSASTNTTSSGAIQQRITNAITAGQSLNTTQTESVRNFLYLYEEYYKSASAVLQAISQIIQKMADGIAR